MPRYSKEARERIAKVLEVGKHCDHPADQRRQIGFGIFCMKCKCRVNFVSRKQGEKLIFDAVKEIYGQK